ncbi:MULTISPECIES: carbohydrate ABC transporter permease [Streptomyces]|uniref:Sugar ABC transporter permease n=3 Tax=Streptomyces TaxID=1883 RepID=A0A8H9LSR2_9ACTN|nr:MULTISPECIES: carbohydrate ABC transporter permease [Streptomyces]NEC14993.1 carbohydrate ABC transporter permease [Streptomyces sp. SID8014]WSU39037.1 carbohydrate ABC transporter permease [Streptomyces gougerotii]SUP34768.1 binding-protein-dependent transport system inner membrane protein [Streptomyces griseus]GFH67123.1 sugar ABC transporter permease [Streptomyces rutgersensis]GFH72398.1 sugar ABC transporter permease [Streptomyces diastaticus subsp. diastaticus]
MTTATGPVPAPTATARDRRRRAASAARLTAVVLVVLVLALPMVWMFAAAFKTNVQVTDPSVGLWFTPTLENFRAVFEAGQIVRSMGNSLLVGVVSTVLSAVIAVPAAWAVGRFAMHRTASVILVARIVPAISLLVPWYYLFAQLGLVGSYTALVLSHMFVSVPLIMWIMISFFAGLPVELEEAAQVDGLSAFGAFWRITLPLAAPGTATASLLAFVFSWNNFMFALVFADDSTQTVPVTLFNFISYASTDWGGLMAATTLITVPVVLAALLGQKYLVAGLTSGASKG